VLLLLAGCGPEAGLASFPVAIERQPSLSGLPEWEHPAPSADPTSGFGPRRISEGTDFHSGVDFAAPIGTEVVAVADGTVFRIHPSESADDGNTLYVHHELDPPVRFHDQDIVDAYTVYSHVDSFLVGDEGDPVSAGEAIATVGDSGGVKEPHLHFELRLGTHCSLAYATESPDSDCGRSWDPAVNPLHVLPLGGDEPPSLRRTEQGFEVSTDRGDWDWARLTAEEGAIDWDLRTGLDATRTEALDDFELGWVTVDPTGLEDAHSVWVLETDADWVEVTDLEGRGWRLE